MELIRLNHEKKNSSPNLVYEFKMAPKSTKTTHNINQAFIHYISLGIIYY